MRTKIYIVESQMSCIRHRDLYAVLFVNRQNIRVLDISGLLDIKEGIVFV